MTMQKVLSILTIIAGVVCSYPAAADDVSFEDRVRAFILDNPEIIVEALSILSEREAKAALEARLTQFPELFSDAPRLGEGDPMAPRRVIEFFDYRCIPCKAVHPELVELTKNHPDLRIEMRHLPILSPGSERAARFALATEAVYGADAYRAVHNKIWEIKGPLNTVGFKRVSDALSLDFRLIETAMDSEAIEARISYNRDAAIALEILGTPAFVTKGSVTYGSTDVGALAEQWLSQ